MFTPIPINPAIDTSILPEEMQECFEECHDKLTIEQLSACRDYFQQKIDTFRAALESGITIEAFENAKKADADGDNEIAEEADTEQGEE